MLTREQNIFLAKKTFAELVYNTAYIEGGQCHISTDADNYRWGGYKILLESLKNCLRKCIKTLEL